MSRAMTFCRCHMNAMLILCGLCCVPVVCTAYQLTLGPEPHSAWSETTGWWTTSEPHEGLRIHFAGSDHAYLTGYVWSENVGWISFASSTNGPFANTDDSNWGVNLDVNWLLKGFAWSESSGWIRFGDIETITIHPISGEMTGFAWSESLGWIHWNNEPVYGVQFDIPLSEQGVPSWWFGLYGLTNDINTESVSDADDDGVVSWEEYVARTSPIDSESFLRLDSLTLSSNHNELFLAWLSVPGVNYFVERLGGFLPSDVISIVWEAQATDEITVIPVEGVEGIGVFRLRVSPPSQ